MFPMIATLDEMRSVKGLVEEERAKLPDADPVELGIMVEVPSTAILARQFAREVSFFSIGTNDLTQYTLAVDRTNEKVAQLYDPFHPAVLRLVREVIEAGHRSGIWVGLCGEMGADPLAVPLLLGLGLDELSVNPGSVPEVKKIIVSLRFEQCRKLAADAMALGSADEIRALLTDFVCREVPDIKLVNATCAVETE